jgi:hypothetical protein
MMNHPDTRICPQLKSCTVTNFWLRDSLYRDTALVHLISTVYGDYTIGRLKPCTATLVMLNNICAMTAKTTPWPLLHRDHFLTKVTTPAGAASANTTYLYCRAVMLKLAGSQHFTKTNP